MFTQLGRSFFSFKRSFLSPFWLVGRATPLCSACSMLSHSIGMSAQSSHSKKSGQGSSKEGLKHIRMKKKRAGKMFPNTNVSAQILGSGTRDSPASVLLIADSTRFLFNCGEGTQRLLMDCGTKSMARLEHIFFTRMTWENVGGSIGMMITMKKVGLPQLTYYGPETLNNFVSSMRIFAQQDMMKLDVKSPDAGPFVNEVMVVNPVIINSSATDQAEVETKPSEAAPLTEELSDNSDTEEASVSQRGRKRKPNAQDTISGMVVKNQEKKRKTSLPSNICVAYICKIHDKEGTFLVDKALSLGLPRGPIYSRLRQGESVTTVEGRVIKPEDVIGPKQLGPTLIVLECPSGDFIDSLVTNPMLSRHHTGSDAATPAAVVHITPASILEDERYREWMNRFDDSVEHIVCNDQCPSVTHLKSRRVRTKLSQVHHEIFPAPSLPQPLEHRMGNVHYARSYERLQLKPNNGWNSEHVQTDDPQVFLDEVKGEPEYESSLADLRAKLSEVSRGQQQPPSSRYPEVVFLGTGSAMPNRERNVTGIVLHVSETENLLMDCGEGTFNQLCRFYGDRTDEVISNLSCIFISHRHADHHVGLLQVLKHRKSLMVSKDNSKSLLLVAPKRVFIWLNQYNQLCEDIIHNLRFIENGDLTGSAEERSKLEGTLLNRLDLEKFETVPVRHCSHAYGLAVTHKEGWKVVYSGDTMPCEELVTAGTLRSTTETLRVTFCACANRDCPATSQSYAAKLETSVVGTLRSTKETLRVTFFACANRDCPATSQSYAAKLETSVVGKGADLLIHEATLEDGMAEEAAIKKHSMMSEAIDIGERMGAKYTVLTHFSGRYPKMPMLPEGLSGKVGIAFDFMRFSLSEAPVLPLLLPTLRHLFAESIQEMEDIKMKRVEKQFYKITKQLDVEVLESR